MRTHRAFALTLIAFGCVTLAATLFTLPLRAALPAQPGMAMADAALKFANTLSEEQKKKALFSWEDPGRTQWHFIPKERTGLPLKAMNPEQRAAAQTFLKTGLSDAGSKRTSSIMELEKVLGELEKDFVKRDPEKYYFSIFGTPAPMGTWGWKVEGHHVSLNFTVVKGSLIATSPNFFGANPAEVREGPFKGRRVLAAEEDMGRELVTALDPKQRKEAIFTDKAPGEIVTGPASKVDPLAPVGIAAVALSPGQKALLQRLIDQYAALMAPALATERLAKVKSGGFDKIHFAWAGGILRGDPHYYRIQGPTFLMEYDNTQNGANHVHTVWRDFSGDFGRDLIREHYQSTAH